MKNVKQKKGITLVLIVIMVVVLLILLAVAYTIYNNWRLLNNTQFLQESTYVGREGQTVQYDSNGDGIDEDWIILTDRDGLVEIISARPMGNLILGYEDPEIKGNLLKYLDLNKDGIPDDLDGDGVIEEGGVDYNKNATTTSDNEDIAIASYNNAITTINSYCKSLVKKELRDKVRSVGASSDTSGNYSSTNFNNWFKSSSTIKAEDENYLIDDRVIIIELEADDTYEEYWLASRNVYEYSDGVIFSVRRGRVGSMLEDYCYLCEVNYDGSVKCNNLTINDARSPSNNSKPIWYLKFYENIKNFI